MAESEELKSFLMKVKEESAKVGLKLNIQKSMIMASGPITSWQEDGETMALFWGALHVLINSIAKEVMTTRKERGPDRQTPGGPLTFSVFHLVELE